MGLEKKIKVLVVDDSALMRRMIADILNNHPDISVIGTAMNGQVAISMLQKIDPDVITLDIEMPFMNGIETLKEVQRFKPTPVVMLSSLTKAGAEITVRALELGAVDFVTKPDSEHKQGFDNIKDELISKVLLAYKVGLTKHEHIQHRLPSKISLNSYKNRDFKLKTVLIGSSTGGPQALKEVVPNLPADLPAQILIVQHMPPKFTDLFAQRLDRISQIRVKEAKDGDIIQKGQALLAPGDYHMTVDSERFVKLNQEPTLWGVRPAVDITLASAAKVFKENLIFVILTGMGHDGTQGAKVLKDFGGYCIAEDQSTSVIYGMPKCVIDAGLADKVSPLHEIADEIVKAVFR